MDTKTGTPQDEQAAEDTTGHAMETGRRIDFDLLGAKKLQPEKHLVHQLPPGAVVGRRKIAG